MQNEFEQEDGPSGRDIRLLGVNLAGAESGNPAVVEGRDLPWLQDTPAERAWTKWEVEWRDVVVLDAENRLVAVYNLTKHDLRRPAAYDSLRTILRSAAR